MITYIDHTLFHFINHSMANPVLDRVCPIMRDRYTWVPFYILGSIWLIYRYRWQGVAILIAAGIGIAISDQTSNLIKIIVQRMRPCHTQPGVRLLVDACSDTFSFTSNHAANHFAIAVFISCLFRRFIWARCVLLCWAAVIAFSQVYVGVHYPADVVSGALLGGAIGYGICSLLKHFVDI